MPNMNLPIGVGDFSKLVDPEKNYLLVDKTPMIATFIDEESEVTLITRPRRWGKTLNFSMLQHFFAANVNGKPTAGLFDSLAIASMTKEVNGKTYSYMQEQGQYAVILLTFKEAKSDTYEQCLSKIKKLICALFKEHRHLLSSPRLAADEIRTVQRFIDEDEKIDEADLENSLKTLSELLYKHTGKPVYIFIDEYDAPVMYAYQREPSTQQGSYLDLLILFMKNFLSAGLKDNPNLKKGLMTGILRISYNEMLSGLNNPLTLGVLNDHIYSDCYGFTKDEIAVYFSKTGSFATHAQLNDALAVARDHYNGYDINGTTLYNPWSVNNYLKFLSPETFWINSGDDAIIRKHAIEGGEAVKKKFTDLIQGKSITESITPYIRFDALGAGQSGLWTQLLYAGYLKATNIIVNGTKHDCDLTIPNAEVFYLYRDIFTSWLQQSFPNEYQLFLTSVAQGDINRFIIDLNFFMLSTPSFRDFTTEGHYHTFVLGLLCSLMQTHTIHSNKETGSGYVDVMLIPKANQGSALPALILEFKHVKLDDQQAESTKRKRATNPSEDWRLTKLKQGAQEGFDQAVQRQYESLLVDHANITQMIRVGVAFLGKGAGARFQTVNLQDKTASPVQEIFPTTAQILQLTRVEQAPATNSFSMANLLNLFGIGQSTTGQPGSSSSYNPNATHK